MWQRCYGLCPWKGKTWFKVYRTAEDLSDVVGPYDVISDPDGYYIREIEAFACGYGDPQGAWTQIKLAHPGCNSPGTFGWRKVAEKWAEVDVGNQFETELKVGKAVEKRSCDREFRGKGRRSL